MSTESVSVSYYEELAPELTFTTDYELAFALLLNSSRPGLQLLAPCCGAVLHTSPTKAIGVFFCEKCSKPTLYDSSQLFLYEISEASPSPVLEWLESCLAPLHGALKAQVLAVATADVIFTAAQLTKPLRRHKSTTGFHGGTKTERASAMEAVARELSGPLFNR